jgi:acetyl-CoA carboxylase biotin carboxyl carrier protein
MGLSHEDVQEILQLLDDLDATELNVRTRHFALSLRREGADGEWVQAMSVLASPHSLTPTHAGREAPAPGTASVAGPASDDSDGLVAVRAPLMGTFYRASKPGAPPFVEVGTPVGEETVVGIVETMKLMNSVFAGVAGRVAEICLDNDQYAEQGAVLMRIAPG